MSTIEDILDKIQHLGSVEVLDSTILGPYLCAVHPPVPWDRQTMEISLGVTLPTDLVQLWRYASRLTLYKDLAFAQWGLEVMSPDAVLEQQAKLRETRNRSDWYTGDLIVGQFLGDLELLVVRCDATSADFGEVVVACEIDPRPEWPTVANTFASFLETFFQNGGRKYWTN